MIQEGLVLINSHMEQDASPDIVWGHGSGNRMLALIVCRTNDLASAHSSTTHQHGHRAWPVPPARLFHFSLRSWIRFNFRRSPKFTGHYEHDPAIQSPVIKILNQCRYHLIQMPTGPLHGIGYRTGRSTVNVPQNAVGACIDCDEPHARFDQILLQAELRSPGTALHDLKVTLNPVFTDFVRVRPVPATGKHPVPVDRVIEHGPILQRLTEKREEMLSVVRNFDALDEDRRDRVIEYWEEFFEMAADEGRHDRILRDCERILG